MKTLQSYTAFSYTQLLITDGLIILIDESVQSKVRGEMEELEMVDGKELLFVEDKQLAVQTEKILKSIVEKDTLLVFPGNGSNYPRKLSPICQEFPKTAGIYAKRFWMPGTDPVVVAGLIFPDRFLILEIKTVVVVDDVISSGLTMQKIHRNNAWRFPTAKWVGVSWMAQVPSMKAKSGVNGYERIATGCVVGKSNGEGKVPINSLSTFRENSEIAQSYARRHFKNPSAFLRLVRG